MTIKAILKRLQAVRDCVPVENAGELALALISVADNDMRGPDPERARGTIAYLLLEAVITGELVPKKEEVE